MAAAITEGCVRTWHALPDGRLLCHHPGMLILLLASACLGPSKGHVLDPTVTFGQEYGWLEVPAASSLWVDSGRIFVCTGGQGLYVVSGTDLFDPWLEDIVDIECHAVDGETGRVEVAAGDQGLAVIHPGNLSIIGSYPTAYPLTALTVDAGHNQAWLGGRAPDPKGGGDHILVVEGILTYSLDNLEQNKWGEYDPAEPVGIAFDDSGQFIARDDGRVDILGGGMDVRASIDAGSIVGGAGAGLLAADGVLWAALGTAGLQAWDVSVLDAPVAAGAWTTGSAWGLAAIDDRLYVGSDDALVVLDVGDPDAPTELGRVALSGMARPEGIYVLDQVAWVTDADAGALAIVNVDDSTIP